MWIHILLKFLCYPQSELRELLWPFADMHRVAKNLRGPVSISSKEIKQGDSAFLFNSHMYTVCFSLYLMPHTFFFLHCCALCWSFLCLKRSSRIVLKYCRCFWALVWGALWRKSVCWVSILQAWVIVMLGVSSVSVSEQQMWKRCWWCVFRPRCTANRVMHRSADRTVPEATGTSLCFPWEEVRVHGSCIEHNHWNNKNWLRIYIFLVFSNRSVFFMCKKIIF